MYFALSSPTEEFPRARNPSDKGQSYPFRIHRETKFVYALRERSFYISNRLARARARARVRCNNVIIHVCNSDCRDTDADDRQSDITACEGKRAQLREKHFSQLSSPRSRGNGSCARARARFVSDKCLLNKYTRGIYIARRYAPAILTT